MSLPAALFSERFPSPLGDLLMLTDTAGRLYALDWVDHEARLFTLLRRQYPGDAIVTHERRDASHARRAIHAYFTGQIHAIEGLAIHVGGTPFQRRVWAALLTIPGGTTMSYRELAQRIGQPSAVRAVGLANGANPISIVVPCHRVIGANRTLTGYGSGLARKRWLLAHEHSALPGATDPAGGRLPGI